MAEGDDDPGDWFAVVDTAQDPILHSLVLRARGHTCLFSGNLPPVLAMASPWLVRLRPEEPLLEAWKEGGRGKNWGIMCRSHRTLSDLRKHFRQFLQAQMPDSRIVMFRFYDPRVFNTYIRAATPEERRPWFEGLGLFAVEGETPDILHNYNLRGDILFDADSPVGG